MITVVVYRDGRPVSGAHVIAVHKTGLWWATAVTSPNGTAQLRTLPGSYFVVAGDNLGNGAWVDNIEDGELAIVNLVPRTNRRYFVDLELRLPVADPVARVLEALRQFNAKLVEVLGDLASKLGVTVPAVELARVARLEGVTAVGPRTVRVYFHVGGSPVHVALVIVASVIAILLLVLAVILVARWAFGEELPTIAKLLAYGVLAGGVASLVVAFTGLVRELQRS